jgi:hypothetical protein
MGANAKKGGTAERKMEPPANYPVYSTAEQRPGNHYDGTLILVPICPIYHQVVPESGVRKAIKAKTRRAFG